MIRKTLLSLAAAGLFIGLFSLLAFWSHLNPPTFVSDRMPADFGLAFEDVELLTDDGVSLAAWFIPRQTNAADASDAPTLIVLHGWPEDKGSVLRGAAPLADQFNLLLFDFRALGRSEGRHSTLGARETRDLKAAMDWLDERGHQNLGVWGFSMGGAVALMGSARDERIGAVVADTSFSRLDLMARDVFRVPVLQHGLALGMRVWSRLFLGIDIRQVAPVDAAADLRTPVLIIHLERDFFVPFAHALRLQEALNHNPDAEFWFRGEGVYGQVPAEYLERLREFFKQHLTVEADSHD